VAGVLCIVLVTALASPPRAAASDPVPEQRRQPPALRITGPNDGEPINHRILRLIVETSLEEGTLFVSVNGRQLTQTPLRATAVPGERSLWRMRLDIDLDVARQRLGIDALAPDAPPVTIGIHLHQAGIGPVAYNEWTGWVGRPWIEVHSLGLQQADAAEAGLAGATQPNDSGLNLPRPVASLHTLGKDMFYLLLAAERRGDLGTSADPEVDGLLRRTLVLATGPCGSTQRIETTQIGLETLRAAGWTQAHLVLLTYSPEMGWRRSEIATAAWK
jgi:hypothetical protein